MSDNTVANRQKRLREKRREEGLVRKEIWINPEKQGDFKALIQAWAEAEREYVLTVISHPAGSKEETTALTKLENARSAVELHPMMMLG